MTNNSKEVLLVTLQGIGNTVLALPIFKALQLKQNRVTAILSENGSADLVQFLGLAEHVLMWNETKSDVSNLMHILGRLSRKKFDEAYALCPAGRRENVLLRLVRAGLKRGWRTQSSFRLLSFHDSKMPFWDESEHDLNSNAMLLSIGRDELQASLKSLKASSALQKMPKQNGSKFRIGAQPYTKNRAKCWDNEKFTALLLSLAAKVSGGTEIHLFGDAGDQEKLQAMAQKLGAQTHISQKWPLLTDSLKQLDFFIGVDSSMAHLAALMDVPTCVLFAYTPPKRVMPLGEKVLGIQTSYPCSPCYRFASGYLEDCQYHLRCIKDLTHEDVLSRVLNFLKLDSKTFSQQKMSYGYLSLVPVKGGPHV